MDRQSAVQRLVNAEMAEKQANEVVAMMADQISNLEDRSDARFESQLTKFREELLKGIAHMELSSEKSRDDGEQVYLGSEDRCQGEPDGVPLARDGFCHRCGRRDRWPRCCRQPLSQIVRPALA